ncbi:probable serine/threonine-protein kinase DDB_G0267514 [Onthophagus taurus]|uniref:probable serine/threonine-protein kinase DDB_G0267514 n=1 Tax=Onthophagus taurus TaxID=166361 RepID=UPI0039BE944D
MFPKLFFILLITLIIIIEVKSYDCDEFREHAIRKCKRHYGESIEICMHKRMKRSHCSSKPESGNTHCGECNCNYCSNNSCTTRCSSCCNREIREEHEICETSYCCHKMCHKKCYTPSCTRNCRSSCLSSIDKKEIITTNNKQQTNITTVINLHNKINNTNIIDMPVKINTTNYNNLNITAPNVYDLNESKSEDQKEERCCEILIELCDPYDNKKCYREKQRYCGKECANYPEKPPQYSVGNVPQIPRQQYIPQNYPVIFPNYNNYQQIQNYPNYLQYPQKYPQVYPQVYPQQYPQIFPQNYNYYPSQIPQGCQQTSTYPFVTCVGNNYPATWAGIPNQPNQVSQNPTNNFYNPNNQFYPGSVSSYNNLQVPQFNYGTGQDLPGQPRTPEVVAPENSNNNNNDNNNNNEADENGIEEDEDDNDGDY